MSVRLASVNLGGIVPHSSYPEEPPPAALGETQMIVSQGKVQGGSQQWVHLTKVTVHHLVTCM